MLHYNKATKVCQENTPVFTHTSQQFSHRMNHRLYVGACTQRTGCGSFYVRSALK